MKIRFLLLGIILLTLLSTIVSAQTYNIQQTQTNNLHIDYERDSGSGMLVYIVWALASSMNALSTNVMTMPIYGYEVTYLSLLLTWVMLFSVLWLAVGTIPLFKQANSSGAKKAFVISLSLLTVFTTPLSGWIQTILQTWINMFFIVGSIVLLWILFKVLGRGQAFGRKYGAETRKLRNEANELHAEEDKSRDRLNREKEGVNNLTNISKKNIKTNAQLKKILEELREAIKKAMNAKGEEAQKEIERVATITATALKYDSNHMEIIRKQDTLTKAVNEENIRLFKKLTADKIDIEKVKERLSGSATDKEAAAKKKIADAELLSKDITRELREVENLDKIEESDENLALKYLETLRSYLTAVPPAYANALQAINNVLNAIDREESITEKLINIINNIKSFQDKIDNDIIYAIKDEYKSGA